jgi:hypothetical protein
MTEPPFSAPNAPRSRRNRFDQVSAIPGFLGRRFFRHRAFAAVLALALRCSGVRLPADQLDSEGRHELRWRDAVLVHFLVPDH